MPIGRLLGCTLFGGLCAALASDARVGLPFALVLGGAGFALAYVVRFGGMGAVGMVIGLFSAVGYVDALGGAFESLSANLATAAAIAAIGGALTVMMMVMPGKSGQPPPRTSGAQKVKAAVAAVLGFFVIYASAYARGDIYQRAPPVISALDFQRKERHPDAVVAAKKILHRNRGITDDRYRATSFSAQNGNGQVELVYTASPDTEETLRVRYFVRRTDDSGWYVTGADDRQ